MKIRNKILFYFSSTVIVMSAVSLVLVFVLFSEYREEEFQQQQFSKISYTIGLVDEFNEMSAEVSSLLNQQDINAFYDEKLLIYNQNKKLIYSSIDSLDISKAHSILNRLSVSNDWIETKEDGYDLIGVYLENNSKSYYAISKAYDYFGHSKKDFLQNVLIGIFIAIVVVVLLISLYLSNIISKPISELTARIGSYDLSDEQNETLNIHTTTSELLDLSEKFNELIKRTQDAFLFQKYSIQHISHELKTPIAVLVSELERLEHVDDLSNLKTEVRLQSQKVKSLGNIINVLLQISKIESGQEVTKRSIRIDDIVFDCISEVNVLYPDFNFEVNFVPNNFNEEVLNISANEPLLKQAFLNLLMNAVHYSDQRKAKITFDCHQDTPKVLISNHGNVLSPEEQRFLFSHFFRGKNSLNKQGFGLGLVLSKQILSIHDAIISYDLGEDSVNTFSVQF